MELLDCYEKLCSCCESSISTNKFYAFSAQTEEKINDLQEQIDNIEISGITYLAGDYIDITDKTISVTGITPNDFASKEDLNELSGKVDTLSATVETISGNTDNKQDKLTAGSFIDISSNTISVKAVVLSRAQWEALTTKDNSVLYLIKED